jgi:hypothetical protein
MRNQDPDIKGGTQTEGVWEQVAEENISTEEEVKWREVRGNYKIRNFINCTPRQA